MILIQLAEIGSDVVAGRPDAHALLEAVIHQREMGQQEVLIGGQVGVDAVVLEMTFMRFEVHEV